ncbi:hypothetical protein PR202_gb27194 [Eleusine coracana subsp. coracana]|uniref:Uncharacterized protein n=1 Tax=Eleusine coracana subsp. coracana TaxID=191504 RepID=A0AAV5FT51_ELECO|nr:hypothetical protein PR202_gb27194 [Eleusine coracana subsp. coracana]
MGPTDDAGASTASGCLRLKYGSAGFATAGFAAVAGGSTTSPAAMSPVECPKYPGFCLTRQKNEYPFVEVFYNPEQAASQARGVDPNITKYSVKVLPFNNDQSVYGFRKYFKKHGFNYSETK